MFVKGFFSTFFILNRVEERAKLGFVIPLPLSVEFAHLSHGFVPALHTVLRLALLFSLLLFSHILNLLCV